MRRLLGVALALTVAVPVWAETANRIVARVNDEIVTQGDVAVRMSGLLQQEDLQIPAGHDEELRAAIVQRLLDERLIMQEAKRLGITVTSEDVLDRLREIRDRAGGKPAFEAMLLQLNLNEEQLKLKIREQLLVQKAIDKQVRSKIRVAPGELNQATEVPPPAEAGEEEVEAYHLLVRVSDQRTPEDARALAEDLYRQITGGADFATVAREHSEGPHAEDGGRLGWLRHGDLLPELDEVLFRLQPGEVSSPLQTRLGFHILMVTARRRVDGVRADDRQQAELRIYQQKYDRELRKWIEGLRQKAYIDIPPD